MVALYPYNQTLPRRNDYFDDHAYCKTVSNGCMQMIGNLISGFDGRGLYSLTGAKVDAYGETVILFDLAQAVPVQYVW